MVVECFKYHICGADGVPSIAFCWVTTTASFNAAICKSIVDYPFYRLRNQ